LGIPCLSNIRRNCDQFERLNANSPDSVLCMTWACRSIRMVHSKQISSSDQHKDGNPEQQPESNPDRIPEKVIVCPTAKGWGHTSRRVQAMSSWSQHDSAMAQGQLLAAFRGMPQAEQAQVTHMTLYTISNLGGHGAMVSCRHRYRRILSWTVRSEFGG
jgi:hypothetical protein